MDRQPTESSNIIIASAAVMAAALAFALLLGLCGGAAIFCLLIMAGLAAVYAVHYLVWGKSLENDSPNAGDRPPADDV